MRAYFDMPSQAKVGVHVDLFGFAKLLNKVRESVDSFLCGLKDRGNEAIDSFPEFRVKLLLVGVEGIVLQVLL